MKKKILILLIAGMLGIAATAQTPEKNNIFTVKRTPEPFLFSVTTLTPQDLTWSLNYSGSYGERVTGPFGYDGVGQQLAVKGYLGSRFTLYANASFGFPGENNTASAQQAEIIHDFIGGKKPLGIRFGAGLGVRRDYSDVKSLLSRLTLSFEAPRWKAGGNLLFEKALAANRDQIDVITSMGFHYRFFGELYGGIEAVGEDLEGFWDKEEAEGGAKLLVGPSINMAPKHSRLSFSVS
ncbi:MAG: hypothetical protein JJE07_14300, partial [Flavobacteriaceae bacterium]|nr:hypothetical protein [Flavobacteriaceae bacterium]